MTSWKLDPQHLPGDHVDLSDPRTRRIRARLWKLRDESWDYDRFDEQRGRETYVGNYESYYHAREAAEVDHATETNRGNQ